MLGAIDKARLEVSKSLDSRKRAALGQFMTPAATARFMASLFPNEGHAHCRLLDAGAGIGSLASAFLERWEEGGFDFSRASVTAFEVDEALSSHLERNLCSYSRRLALTVSVMKCDFIEAGVHSLTGDMFGQALPAFTHAILNPPYKKMSSNSRHRFLLREVGIETVNLYTAFVALALEMMEHGGHLVAIVPRSFCNGPYYRPFRELILARSAIRRMHLFDARDRAFKDDDVLQENIIVHLERGGAQDDVAISTSRDDLFHDCTFRVYPFQKIVFPGDSEKFIHVPTTQDDGTIELPPSFRYSLADLDIQVSTGPVVDFRLRDYLRNIPEDGTVPLLYPCHFTPKGVEWPKLQGKKPNAIVRNEDTEKWLYPVGFYTVVRRFSTKEERRRIVASVVSPAALATPMLGFENHLNVFHRHRHSLPEQLAWGLAVFLNSTVVDNAFRRFNGNTQVNATDLRAMKYPDCDYLMKLGRWAMKKDGLTQTDIDRRIGAVA